MPRSSRCDRLARFVLLACSALLGLVVAGRGTTAWAQDPAASDAAADETSSAGSDAASEAQPGADQATPGQEAAENLSHAGQLGIAVAFGGGGLLRVVYDVDTNPCNDEDPDNPVCTGGAPLFLDAELSYGVTDGVELALPLRIALTDDEGDKPLILIPMARLWPLEPGLFNLFFEVGLPVMLSPRTDVGAHFGVGLQIDVSRMFGVRVGVFPDAFFAEELTTTFNVGLGLQGRLLNW